MGREILVGGVLVGGTVASFLKYRSDGQLFESMQNRQDRLEQGDYESRYERNRDVEQLKAEKREMQDRMKSYEERRRAEMQEQRRGDDDDYDDSGNGGGGGRGADVIPYRPREGGDGYYNPDGAEVIPITARPRPPQDPSPDNAAFDSIELDGLQAAGISFFIGGLVLSALSKHPAFAAAGAAGGALAAGAAFARE